MGHKLIIGASSGIGQNFYEMMTAKGEDWVAPRRDELDVGRAAEVERYLSWNSPLTQEIDEIVWCAGENYLARLGEMNPSKTVEIFDSNVIGFIYFVDELIRYQTRNHPVSIVVIGSDAAERPMRTSIAYCASKAALHMAARVVCREMAEHGWRVNVVAPGMTEGTGMTEYVDETVMEVRGWSRKKMMDYERTQEVTPGRIERAEVSQVILDVLRGPRHLNGAIVKVNGGR